jgi:hypothetical protein
MKVLSVLALAVLLIGATAPLHAGAIGLAYLDDSLGDLFVGDPTTGNFSLVGTSATAAGFGGFTDIGFAGSVLYGLRPNGTLYTISTSTGQILTTVGNTGVNDGSLVGLSDSTNATTLVAGGNGQIYSINTSTGAATPFGTGEGQYPYQTAGDDTFANGTLYLTSTIPNADSLFSINQTNGAGTSLGQLCSATGCAAPWTDVFGMIYDTSNSTMYGFDVDGDEFNVNLASPNNSGNILALEGVTPTEEGDLLGAAFIAAPEPSTFGIIGSALILLAVGVRRKANQTV